jgi:hypothetical protein
MSTCICAVGAEEPIAPPTVTVAGVTCSVAEGLVDVVLPPPPPQALRMSATDKPIRDERASDPECG